jgi:hypothetical protein
VKAARLRGVVERRVDGVDVLRQPDGAAGDAAGQRRGVAHHQDVAVGVGGDRGQRERPEVVLDVEVAEQELVGVRLVDLRELLALAQAAPPAAWW